MRTIGVLVLCFGAMAAPVAAQTSISTVASADGTPLAIECAGAGPSLLREFAETVSAFLLEPHR